MGIDSVDAPSSDVVGAGPQRCWCWCCCGGALVSVLMGRENCGGLGITLVKDDEEAEAEAEAPVLLSP